MPEYNEFEYKFDFFIYNENEKISSLTYEDAADMFKKHICCKKSPILMGVNYEKLEITGISLNEPQNKLKKDSMKLAEYSDNRLTIINKDMLGVLADESYIKNKVIGKLKNYEYDFKRANKKFESISAMFKRVDGETFDSYDFDYDIIVTIVEPYDDIDIEKPYDVFCKNVYDRVNVIQDENEKNNLCCDWTEFVYRYYDKLKSFSDKYWKINYKDPERFVEEWIDDIQSLLAGYSSDYYYKLLNDIIETEPETDSEIYKNFLNDNIIPFMSKQTKENMQKNTYDLIPENVNKETEHTVDAEALEDYKRGKPFPDTSNFKGLKNYHIIAELNDTVIGIRSTDYLYATWKGKSSCNVLAGRYNMDRKSAYEDFALRAGLIDEERYMSKKQYEKYKSDEPLDLTENCDCDRK